MTPEERHRIIAIARAPSLVLLGLVLLFGANLGLSFAALGRFNLVANLLIAAAMVALIALFFMELIRSSAIHRLAAVVGIFWLMFFFVLGFADYLTR